MQPNLFIKRVLQLDAASCLGMGAMLAAGAGGLSPLFGLERPLLLGAGAALVPIGLFILWAGTRETVRPLAVYAIIAGNLLWVIESLLVVRSADGISALGTTFVLAQAGAVAMLALLETIGVRRARRPAAQA